MGKTEDLQNDPIYGEAARRAAHLRNLTDAQRKKLERDAQRIKVTFDASPELKALLDQLQKALDVPMSDLLTVLIGVTLQAVDSGQVNLEDYIYTSRLPRYQHRLHLVAPDSNENE
jgi:hypothetical protein